MSDKNNDFDLSGFEGFDEDPNFSGLDSEFIDMAPVTGVTGRRNTRFIILASVLVLLILLGAVAIILLAADAGTRNVAYQQTANAVYLTNTAVSIALTETEIVRNYTKTPTPTSTPTDTFTPTPTETPTDTPTLTPSPTTDFGATETLEFLQRLTMQPVEQTGTAAAAFVATQQAAALTQTAAAFGATLTQIAVFSGSTTPGAPTAVPPAISPTANNNNGGSIIGGNGTPIKIEIVGPIVVISPTPVKPTKVGSTGSTGGTDGGGGMPNTGFLDEIAGGNANPTQLFLLAGAALGLVGVIVFARRMRVRTH